MNNLLILTNHGSDGTGNFQTEHFNRAVNNEIIYIGTGFLANQSPKMLYWNISHFASKIALNRGVKILNFEKKISSAVIRRLPRYYRYLTNMLAMGISRVSSKDLSKKMGITSSQVRQDFFCFGGFGLQGYGYEVESLHKEVTSILGIDTLFNMILIGAGNLGQALINHTGFEKRGYKIVGVFDVNPKLVGGKIRNLEIMHKDDLAEFVKHNPVDIAIIAVPAANAHEAAMMAIGLGIKALWNFSPIDLQVPEDVVIENIYLSDSLMVLGYRLKELRLKNPQS